MLDDGTHGEPRPSEAEPIDDQIGEVGLEVTDDDVRGTDIELEADELVSATRATTTTRRPPPVARPRAPGTMRPS